MGDSSPEWLLCQYNNLWVIIRMQRTGAGCSNGVLPKNIQTKDEILAELMAEHVAQKRS